MKRTGLTILALFALGGCLPEYPPPQPVAQYSPPPPPSPTRPAHHRVAVAVVTPKPRPEESKAAEAAKPHPDKVNPLHEGTLSALSVGNYMDGQEKDLRTQLRGSGVIVSRVGDNLVLNIQADRLFDGTAPALSPRGEAVVHTVADSVRRFDSTTLSVNGFTDVGGGAKRDVKLSQAKAETVDKALVADGVDPRRVSAKGFGAGDLKVPNAKDARNRRIEIDITPRVKT